MEDEERTATEKFYDEHIAPELARIAKLCTDNGMSFVAAVEYNPGEIGQTLMFLPSVTWQMRMANIAMASNGNIDGLFINIARVVDRQPELDAGSSILLRLFRNQVEWGV